MQSLSDMLQALKDPAGAVLMPTMYERDQLDKERSSADIQDIYARMKREDEKLAMEREAGPIKDDELRSRSEMNRANARLMSQKADEWPETQASLREDRASNADKRAAEAWEKAADGIYAGAQSQKDSTGKINGPRAKALLISEARRLKNTSMEKIYEAIPDDQVEGFLNNVTQRRLANNAKFAGTQYTADKRLEGTEYTADSRERIAEIRRRTDLEIASIKAAVAKAKAAGKTTLEGVDKLKARYLRELAEGNLSPEERQSRVSVIDTLHQAQLEVAQSKVPTDKAGLVTDGKGGVGFGNPQPVRPPPVSASNVMNAPAVPYPPEAVRAGKALQEAAGAPQSPPQGGQATPLPTPKGVPPGATPTGRKSNAADGDTANEGKYISFGGQWYRK